MKNTDKLKGKGKILYLDEDYGISIEFNSAAMCIAHCEINTPTKTVIKACRDKIDELQMQWKIDAYGIAFKDDLKHQRFLKLMGFEFYQHKWALDADTDQDVFISIFIRRYQQ